MDGPDIKLTHVEPLQRLVLAAGIIGFALCLIGAYFNREEFFRSYLTAYVFWLGVPLGCLGIVMIHHLVGGTWGFVIQRTLEAAIRTFPVMAALFVPLFFGLPDLYMWARPDAVAHDKILQHKSLYLNIPFFTLRSVLYFGIWMSVGYCLTRWSQHQDRTGNASMIRRLQTLSGPGLVLYGLTVTFSVIDWLMSLEPRWYSTIYGMIFMVSYGLTALVFVIGVCYFLSRRGLLSELLVPPVFHDLGNLLLAFVMLWAYLSFSQFLLVWVENLRQEIPWYLRRIEGGWGIVVASLIAAQFALPFLLLLSRTVKRRAPMLCGVAILVGVMHWFEIFWFVAPTFHPEFRLHWSAALAPLAIGGVWVAAFLSQLRKPSLLPLRDPRFLAIIEERGLIKNG